jgi:peroxiredoxin
VARALAADTTPTQVTVLARENTLSIDRALVLDGDLLVPAKDVQAITGFELKPQGLCAGDVCIALPPGDAWVSVHAGEKYFHVTRFASKVNQVFAVDPEQRVWSFTAVPRAETSPLLAGAAPDFALADRQGKIVRLSDFRGKKVLILTWASWCGCRFDLAGWQKVYEGLKDKNFEIIAAAQDTAGPKVVDTWYEKAHVTFTALVDPNHTVSSLCQMVNVPAGVWVDESGKVVRPAEVAYSKQQRVLGQLIGDDRYAAGLADWVEKGAASEYAVSSDRLQSKLAVRSADERLADAHFKLGAYFSEHGKRELAAKHWQESQRLSPSNWNYHRQDWSFDKAKEMSNWLAKVRSLGGKPYYDPVEFPAAKTTAPAAPARP